MVLELSKAITLFVSILSLYPAAISAFFAPGLHWEDRLLEALLKLAIAGCVCFFSGLLFAWPSHANAGEQRLMATLPVRMFLWATLGICVLFCTGWYVTCGSAFRMTSNATCERF